MKTLTLLTTRLLANPELEQASLRLTILVSVLAYVAVTSSRIDVTDVLYLGGIFLIALGIFAANWGWPAANVSRRVLGMVVDAGAITFALLVTANSGVIFVWMYLFVIIGNGFRYGRIYLHVSQVLCMVGFLTVLAIAPWWQSYLFVGVNWLIAMLILPLYVAVFFERVRKEHLRTEQALKRCLEREGRSG